MGGVVREGDEIFLSTPGCDGCRSPYIGVDFVAKVLGWDTDAWLEHGKASGASEDARFAVGFRGDGIQLDPFDGSALDEFSDTGDGNMAKATMELHDRQGLNGMCGLWEWEGHGWLS